MRQEDEKVTLAASLTLVRNATDHLEELVSIFHELQMMNGQRGEKNRSCFIRLQLELENAFEDLKEGE